MSTATTVPDRRAELQALAEMRHRDPALALSRAQALQRTVPSADHGLGALCAWVLGLALHELGRPRAAVGRYREAARRAALAGDRDTEARARAGLASSLLALGDCPGAEAEIARARMVASGAARGLVDLVDGVVAYRTGRLDQALLAYRRSFGPLRRADDGPNIARLLICRGALYASQGRLDLALRDQVEAEELARSLDLRLLVAMAAHNAGFTQGRQGDLPEGLASLDRAQAGFAALGNQPRFLAVVESDRCELLLAAGLASEARAAATAALGHFAGSQDANQRAEARLQLAQACLAQGDLAAATDEARRAARAFRAAGRPSWAALADYVAIQAEVRALEDQGSVPPATVLARTRRAASALDAHGWRVEAAHVRTFLGRIALARGRTDLARTELAAAVTGRSRGTARLRVEAWHATALMRLAEGDAAGAKRALVRGIKVVDEHRAAFGATELRARAGAYGSDLARLGLRLALADRRATDVLTWAERWRAGALRLRPVHAPENHALSTDLAELRRLEAHLRDVTLAGEPADPVRRAIAEREAAITSKAHRVAGGAAAPGTIDVAALRRRVGERALVEFVAIEEQLHAVTVIGGRTRLTSLCPTAVVEHEKAFLLFRIRRLMMAAAPRDPNAEAGLPGAVVDAGVDQVAARVDRLLLEPLRIPAGVPVVVVPTGPLHGLPWAVLPSLADRAVTVAPSADIWMRHAQSGSAARRPPELSVLLVAGPDLPGGEADVAELAAVYPTAERLTGAAATVDAVVAGMERADLVHIAAHGRFRSGSPLFSSLRLVDGSLTVYDLERLRSAPTTVVLPACDAALAEVRPGDELLGTATALVALGVHTVVAPVMPVPDAATTGFVLDLHHRLREGATPAVALAAAAAAGRRGDAVAQVVAASFVAIGADDERRPC